MKIYKLEEIVATAKKSSPYYRDLYAKIHFEKLIDLPVVNQVEFWKKNSWKNNQLLTGSPHSGIVFKSGGTTGEPKFSIFTQEEWETFTTIFGTGMSRGGLKNGERVANLFYAGDLYASFLFIMKSIENSGAGALHFPISGAVSPENIIKMVHEYGIETLAGVPTTLLDLARKGEVINEITRILFGGESMYDDQRIELQKVFPNAKIQSIGIASVDAGHLGFATAELLPNVHHTFYKSSVVEILDIDTGEVIEENGRMGRMVYTNLTRTLMPIIRYPSGDLAEWIDSNEKLERRYLLRGRAEEGARVGPATLYYEDLLSILAQFKIELGLFQYQMLITHEGLLDKLTVKITSERIVDSNILVEAILKSRPMLKDLCDGHKIHRPHIEFTSDGGLEKNQRTGKLKRIIDLRS